MRETLVLFLLAGSALLVPTRAVASDVDPIGDVTASGSGIGTGDCTIKLSGGFTPLCLTVSTVSTNTIRFANFGFMCAPDSVGSPCVFELTGIPWATPGGGALANETLTGFPTGDMTLKMNFNVRVRGAGLSGVTSGTAKFCIPTLPSGPCLQVPFQLTGDGQIAAAPMTMPVSLPAPYQITAEIDVTLPAGASLLLDDVSLLFVQGTTLGALQLCKVAGPGVATGTSYGFTVQGPDFHVTTAVPAGSCSFALNLFTSTSIVVTESAASGTTVSGINGGSTNNLAAGSAGLVIGSSTSTVTFTNKALNNQACDPGYFKNHPGSFAPPYTPQTIVGSVFSGILNSLSGITFSQALQGGGGNGLQGAENQLLRSGVTAVLNAANPAVEYSYTLANVINLVNTAMASGDASGIKMLASTLDQANNALGGCPLH